VLWLTERSQKRDLLQGLELGAHDYLTKSFDARERPARPVVGGRILGLPDDLLGAQEELHFRAINDALTCIPNRPAILEALGKELARQVRDERPFGIVLGDIDHCKNVNNG
jgi:PleD family two-component response regulator